MQDSFNSEDIEETKPFIVGHLLIRDAETGKVLVNQRDVISPVLVNVETQDVAEDEE